MASIQNVVRRTIRQVIQEQRGGYGTKVREIIARLNEIPKNVSDDEARRLAVNIAESMDLQYLGSGIHRAVYAIDDDHVLKIGSPRANDVESDPKVQAILGPFATKVYYRGPYAIWVIAERVRVARDIFKWWNDAGVPDFDLTGTGLEAYDYAFAVSSPEHIKRTVGDERVAENFIMNIVNSDIGRRLLRVHNETKVFVADLQDVNVGYGSDGRPVILDLGHAKGFHAVKESKSIREQRGGYGSKVREIIAQLTDKNSQYYDNPELLAIKLGLKKLGQGIHRRAYAIDDDHVLKIGQNLSNDVESDPKAQAILGPFAVKVYYRGPYARWIIVESVRTCRSMGVELGKWWLDAGIKALANIHDEYDQLFFLSDIQSLVSHYQTHHGIDTTNPVGDEYSFGNDEAGYDALRHGRPVWLQKKRFSDQTLSDIMHSDIMRRLIKLSQETNIEVDDLHVNNLGYASDGRPVILDLGMAQNDSQVSESLRLIDESLGSKADFIIRKLRNVEKMAKGGDDDLQMALERTAKELSKQGHLKHLATATRTVWRIVGEDLVLKIMGGEDDLYNDGVNDGVDVFNYHQNKFEASPQLQQIMGPYFPKTIARGRHHRWIISELVKPITPYELDAWAAAASLPEELVFKGKIWLDVFYEMMREHYADDLFEFEEELAVYNIHLNQSDIVPMEQNDLFMRLVRAHNEVGVSLGDLKWRNLGWSLEDGRPVILDLGA